MLAGPILTPVVFLEDKAFSAKWPALNREAPTSVGVSFCFSRLSWRPLHLERFGCQTPPTFRAVLIPNLLS